MSHFDPPSVRAMQALKRLGAAPANQGVGTSGLRRVSSALRRLSDLVDVRVSTLADKDSLVFDASSGVWVPGSPRLRLGELQDVEVVAPDDGYPLMWSSTLGRWVPEPDEDYTVSSVVMSRVWDSDGHSGLFDALGTNDGTTPFSNPSPALVTLSLSTLYGSGVAANATDQTGNDLHTNDVASSWWSADFGAERAVVLSRVGLRARTGSSGSHSPRNFKVQGSNNGTDWTDLLTVSGAGPSGAGNWWSSAVSTTTPYRHLRILQTGNNSSGTQHLVIGEVEFWGDLLGQVPIRSRRIGTLGDVDLTGLSDGDTLVWDAGLAAFVPGSGEGGGGIILLYERVWESNGYNGLMRAIGTQGGETPFQNPALMSEGGVVATLSTTHDARVASQALDGTPSEAHSTNVVGSWWQVDVGEGRTLAVTQFGLMGRDYPHNHPRNFRLEGSNDGTTWDTLYTSTATGPTQNTWWSVPIVTEERYRFLRVFNYGNDSSGGPYLVIGEFEVWGALYEGSAAPVLGLSTLPDVDVEGILDGNVLVYDAEDGIWKPGEGGGGGDAVTETFDQAVAALSGRVHHWRFDESSGTTVADSVGSLPLTLSGTYTRNSDEAPTGRKSTYFGGTDSHAVSVGSGSIPSGNAARTILIVTKTVSYARGFMFSHGEGATRKGFGLTGNDSASIVANYWTWSDDLPWAQTSPLSDGAWHLLAATYDGNRAFGAYKDGEQISKVLTQNLSTTAGNFYVGSAMGTSNRYVGNVADVIVFDRALSKAELDRLYLALNSLSAVTEGGGPTIKDRRWTEATTDVSIDEFNGSSIDVAWTYAAHASIPALPSLARPRYVQSAGVLSVKYGSETGVGGGTNDGGTGRHHAILRPLSGAGGSMSVGDAFYCAQTGFVRDTTNHRVAGLVLSTSADSGAGQQLCARWVNVGAECRVGGRTLSNWNGDTPVGGSDIKVFQGLVYIRIVKMTSTTWRWDTSADGVSWMLGSSIFTWAHEPTHVGFVESNWNTNTQSVVSYEFLRRQSGVT